LKLLSQAHGAPSTQDFATPKSEGPNELPAASPVLLLAFLTLTSRFHPGLIAHHSPAAANRPSNPHFASEYYASACKNKLNRFNESSGPGAELPRPLDIYRVQAYLMLAFHEWGNCKGTRAWELLGVAIRTAHLIGLNFQDDVESSYLAKNSIVQPGGADGFDTSVATNSEDMLREQETRRRTFWSCFILERCLSSGRFMPFGIRAEDVRIQLPASDRAFLFNEKVRTALLSDSIEDVARAVNGDAKAGSAASTPAPVPSPGRARDAIDPEVTFETGPYEGLVSRYIKASEAYSAVIQWACRGGRL
jgi:hypothetical protein